MVTAMERFIANHASHRGSLAVLFTSDEEVGSPSTRDLIEAEAALQAAEATLDDAGRRREATRDELERAVALLGVAVGLVPAAGAAAVALWRRRIGSRYGPVESVVLAATGLLACGVLPLLRERFGSDVGLTVVGMTGARNVLMRAAAGLDIRGVLPDLFEVYSRARVFVAPTRFAAGIPLKVYDAAAHGVPTVITPILARAVGWTHERETLVAASPADFASACHRLHEDRELWERIRSAALEQVRKDCSTASFDHTVAAFRPSRAELRRSSLPH